MIIVTGAAGFIGSNLVRKLNDEGFKDIVLVDDFTSPLKNKNFENKTFSFKIDRSEFIEWIPSNHRFIQFIFHMGARTDTTEFDVSVFKTLNLDYSKMIWNKCIEFGLPLVYASSAATYGLGEQGYHDDHTVIEKLKPLNPYAESKNEFDKWTVRQERKPYYWAGLKFFNVYGPNEYHKDRMASVVFHTFNQIKNTGEMKLFRSFNPEFKDGEQARDFVYVKDVIEVMYFLMHHRKDTGIYNVGTGKAETFLELVRNTFKVMHMPEKIKYIDIPADIRDKYQYFTEAKMGKLRSIGYKKDFYSLEHGISDYVTNYLMTSDYY